jgi:hypothetical protein
MSAQPFETASRRLALAVLGATGLAAWPATPARSGQNAKAGQQARKKCRSQGRQCEIVFATFCGGSECAERRETCCPLAAACDFASFMNCFFTPFGSEP